MRRTYSRRGYVPQPPLCEQGPSRQYLDRALYAQELYDELEPAFQRLAAHYGLAKVLRVLEHTADPAEAEQLLRYTYGDHVVSRRPKV